MLRWRLLLGTLIIAALAGLCWLDHAARLPGTWLMPLAVVFVILATAEASQLMAAAGAEPRAGVVYCGNVLMLLFNWIPMILAKWNIWPWPGEGRLSWQQAIALVSWPFLALMICTLVLFVDEMRLFQRPGRAIANMAASAFALIYVGVLVSFLVQMRLAWGIGALVSLIIVVKMGDTGAYLVGRLVGRHKMTPIVSPGKTWEGAVGAIFFACLGAWLSRLFLLPAMNGTGAAPGLGWSWIAYGILVGIAGILGDLAESLLKRDAGRKDSSTWMPGFGGVLDVLDSLLFAAPVGWAFWLLQSAG
ncbi:MAG: phosphatidate cytidylyltransferase [Thermoguttaceae bacterium]